MIAHKLPPVANFFALHMLVKYPCYFLSKVFLNFAFHKGGEYVMTSTKAAWAAWQGAIADLIEQYKAETGKKP